MKRFLMAASAVGLLLAGPVFAGEGEGDKKGSKKARTAQEKRAAIDAVAEETLKELLSESEDARALYDVSHGYAVFDNTRVTILIGTGGGGSGVAVDKSTGERTYMKMGTGGLALGIGAQKYQVVLLFEEEAHLAKFINKGWKAEGGANASAGKKGANVGKTFQGGVAVFQITEKGLLASVDISGTKYKVNKKLN